MFIHSIGFPERVIILVKNIHKDWIVNYLCECKKLASNLQNFASNFQSFFFDLVPNRFLDPKKHFLHKKFSILKKKIFDFDKGPFPNSKKKFSKIEKFLCKRCFFWVQKSIGNKIGTKK
jgi:hypothetical protein